MKKFYTLLGICLGVTASLAMIPIGGVKIDKRLVELDSQGDYHPSWRVDKLFSKKHVEEMITQGDLKGVFKKISTSGGMIAEPFEKAIFLLARLHTMYGPHPMVLGLNKGWRFFTLIRCIGFFFGLVFWFSLLVVVLEQTANPWEDPSKKCLRAAVLFIILGVLTTFAVVDCWGIVHSFTLEKYYRNKALFLRLARWCMARRAFLGLPDLPEGNFLRENNFSTFLSNIRREIAK